MSQTNDEIVSVSLKDAERPKPLRVTAAARACLSDKMLSVLESIANEIHQTLTITSAYPGYEANAQSVQEARTAVDEKVFQTLRKFGAKRCSDKRILASLNSAIKLQGCGNCYEFSLMASHELTIRGYTSEIARVKGESGDNHVYVMILQKGLSDDIIFDVYMNKVYLESEILDELQSCVYKEATNTVRYINFDPSCHSIDKNLVNELLQDWRGIFKPVALQGMQVVSKVLPSSSETLIGASANNYFNAGL